MNNRNHTKTLLYLQRIEDKHAKDKRYSKVKENCHYTEKYRGVTHSAFVLQYALL